MRALGLLGRVLLGIVTVTLGLVALAGVAAVILSGTPWGHERVRRLAVTELGKVAHGRVVLGRISGNLLSGMTVENVAITDSSGAPFLAVAQATARYDLWAIVHKKIWLTGVRLVRPTVVLDKRSGSGADSLWNYQRIFPPSSTPTPPNAPPGWGSWIRVTNGTVSGGHLIIRTPWTPPPGLTRVQTDSAIRDALDAKSRVAVVSVPGGYQKIVDLRNITSTMPLVRLADPAYAVRLVQVASLHMDALPFRPPAAEVRDLNGTFQLNLDSLWWRQARVALPASRVSGDGSYGFNTGNMRLALHGAPAALADLRWLYPRLPSSGGGTLAFYLDWQGKTQEYVAKSADVRTGTARITGDFGLTLGDTFSLHDTNLRFAAVDTRLLEQLIPNLHSPRRGRLDGRAKVAGGRGAMRVDADVAFDDVRSGTSRVAAVGEIGFASAKSSTAKRATTTVRAKDLRLVFRPVQVDLVRIAVPTLPIGGTVTGSALVNGSSTGTIAVVTDLDHVDRGAHSSLIGHAALRMGGTKWVDADLTARPLSLVEVGRFAPAVGLTGWAAGPIRATGPMSDLVISTDLQLPEGGQLSASGHLDLASAAKGYDLAVGLHLFDAQAVLTKGPRTSITARATAHGTGTNPATLEATLGATVFASSWDSVMVDSGAVQLAAANGVARVSTLAISGAHTHVNAAGSFGLASGRSGTLNYRVAVDSLSALDRFLPHSAGSPDTGSVPPRPGRIVQALRRTNADSARVAKATEVERAATGKALPRIQAQLPPSAPMAVSGSLNAAGTLAGNLYDFDLRGRLAGEHLDVHGNTVYRLRSEYALSHIRTPAATYALGLTADSVTAAGFAFDTVDARVSYHDAAGQVQLLVRQGAARDYSVQGDYTLSTESKELRVGNLRLRFDTTVWAAPHPAAVAWRANGLVVENLELRSGPAGRVYANGLLPTSGSADFALLVDGFDVGNIADLLQSGVDVDGLLSLHAQVHGTLAAPTFQGALGLAQGSYNGAAIPTLRATFGYTNKLLATHLDMLHSAAFGNLGSTDATMAVLDARLPIDLSLQRSDTGSRLQNAPASADLVADSLPLDLVPQFTGAVSELRGLAAGRVSLRGTLQHPTLTGGLVVSNTIATITWPGLTLSSIAGSIRMANDTVYVDSLAAVSHGPVRITGTVALAGRGGVGFAPTFNLRLTARNALVLNNMWGRLNADASLTDSGSFQRMVVAGTVNITGGVIYAPEPVGRHVISAGDPGLFKVVDTTVTQNRLLFPAPSPLEQNLRMRVAVTVERNTWVRNQEANVEIFTDFPVNIRYVAGQLGLSGAVATDRGEYNFMSKRFQVSRGSATFTSGFELDPLLQITGDYQVQIPNGPATDIKVLVGGTLRRPSLSLDSDMQPPRTQSELLSLLAFGTSQTTFGQGSGTGAASSVTGVGSSGDLVGAGAALAMNRMTSVAMGVAVEQLQQTAGRALGTDYFDITPGATPQVAQLSSNWNFSNFIADTQIEAGKYINPRTFLGFQEQTRLPGANIEYRTNGGWRYSAMAQPRVILQQPTLASQPWISYMQVGAFILRDWRF